MYSPRRPTLSAVLLVAVLGGAPTGVWAMPAPARVQPAASGSLLARTRAGVQRGADKIKNAFSSVKPKIGVARSTPMQRAFVAAHVAATGAAMLSIGQDVKQMMWTLPVALASTFIGYHLADPIMAPGHHELDNYHQHRRGFIGYLARYFQHHHDDPSDVIIRDGKRRGFADLVQTTAPVTPFALGLLAALPEAPPGASPGQLLGHVALKAGALGLLQGAFLSVAAHAYSHTNPKNIPRVAQVAQKLGLFITGKEHGIHHHDPFDKSYGIQTGKFNKLLDKLNVYRWKERVRYNLTGAIPNSWRGEKGKEVMQAAIGKVIDLPPPLPIPDDVGPSNR